MELKSAAITILVGIEKTTIQLHDNTSGLTFLEVELTPDQLSSALSRLAYTDCKVEVFGVDKLNKKQEHKIFEFEIEKEGWKYRSEKGYLKSIANRLCPEGWVCDNHYNSQDSFFTKDGKIFARTTIRRWVD